MGQGEIRGYTVQARSTDTFGRVLDRSNPVRRDVTVFNSVHLRIDLKGVTQAQGSVLIDRFKGR